MEEAFVSLVSSVFLDNDREPQGNQPGEEEEEKQCYDCKQSTRLHI
jgi:hypothetical protein